MPNQAIPTKSARLPVHCPVCDGTEASVVFTPTVQIDDPTRLFGAASGLPGTQTIVRCQNCSMIYENPRFPEEAIIAGYSSSNDAGHDSQHAMRVNSFHTALEKIAPHLPARGAKVLDVGTAGGAFLEAAKRFGYDATGLEPSRYLVDCCKERGLDAVQGTIDDFKAADGTYDLITLWDVIEHLARPKDALRRIHQLLKPGGVLLINYPDIGTWQAKLAGRRFWWLLSVHLSYFAPPTIREICRRAGFSVFYIRPYWQTLKFGYLEEMAIHYKIPLAAQIHRLTPRLIREIPVRYYASQTTALARKEK